MKQLEELYGLWKDLTGNELLQSYKECVTESIIQGVSPAQRVKLRDFLHNRNVNVRKGSGARLTDVLTQLLPSKEETHVNTLPPKDVKDTIMHANALLRIYSNEDKKFGGMLGENLYNTERDYDLTCKALHVPHAVRVANAHVLFKGKALDYFLSHIKGTEDGHNLTSIFKKLKQRFSAQDRKQRAIMKWNTLTFDDYSKEGESKTMALDKLVKEATNGRILPKG